MRKTKFSYLLGTLLTFTGVNAVNLSLSPNQLGSLPNPDNAAYAKSSGGRTGGGSFRRSSPSRSTSPSRSEPSNSRPNNSNYDNNRDRGGTTVVPVIINNGQSRPSNGNGFTSSSSDGDVFMGILTLLVILIIFGGIGWGVFYLLKRATSPIRNALGSSFGFTQSELGNDTVTVTKLQVAMLAQAREIQSRLSEISLEVDTETPEGLHWLMQESVVALLRTPENWTHALASSQAVKTEAAEKIFNQISVAERSKFSAETLVNVRGVSRKQKPIAIDPEKEPAAYIVITLLIGTEHDKPLFGQIRSQVELQTALEAIAAIPASHLLIFELLWSPQAETDSLTYDELLTEYSDMVQI
jgi:uncharacterized membrane protein